MSTQARILIAVAGSIVLLFILTRLGVFSGRRPEGLGVKAGRLAPCPDSPNCVSTQAVDAEHWIDPIPYAISSPEAKERLLRVIRAMLHARVIVNEPSYLYVEFRTFLMQFADDVEFYLDEDERVIHFRSASRLGYSDMGLNRRRMDRIRDAFAFGQ